MKAKVEKINFDFYKKHFKETLEQIMLETDNILDRKANQIDVTIHIEPACPVSYTVEKKYIAISQKDKGSKSVTNISVKSNIMENKLDE